MSVHSPFRIHYSSGVLLWAIEWLSARLGHSVIDLLGRWQQNLIGIGMSSIISLLVLIASSFDPRIYPHSRGIAAQY